MKRNNLTPASQIQYGSVVTWPKELEDGVTPIPLEKDLTSNSKNSHTATLMEHRPREFGMVAIEAAAHGLATVDFEAGRIVDAVRNNISGYLVECGNYSGMGKRVVTCRKELLPARAIQNFAKILACANFGNNISSNIVNSSEPSKNG
ncbi:glycosyltransferase [Marinobacter sp. W-8]|uniref:glycosyltransferase n=1 Tax=Marinobacter sp. W-8 TaxID=3369658 RepID=UPI0037CC733B